MEKKNVIIKSDVVSISGNVMKTMKRQEVVSHMSSKRAALMSLFGVAACLLMAGCGDVIKKGDDNGTVPPNQPGEISVQFKLAAGVVSKAGINPSLPVNSAATPDPGNGGFLIFSNEAVITKKVKILPSAYDTDGVGDNITWTALQSLSGATITKVPSITKSVVLYLNLPDDIYAAINAIAVGSNVSQINQQIVTVKDLLAPDFGTSAVPVSGAGDLNFDVPTNASYQAMVDIVATAMASRIEIGAFTLQSGIGITIESYELGGIYINNFYPHVSFAQEYPLVTKVGDEPGFFIWGDPSYYYNSTAVGDSLTGLYIANVEQPYLGVPTPTDPTANLRVTPGDNKVWGFNLIPTRIPNEDTGASDDLASIVFHLKNVVVTLDDGTTTTFDNRFVTVNAYVDNSSGDQITHLERGKVYKFANVNVGYQYISEVPNAQPFKANITISVLDWELAEIGPVF
jgi:hypothetical protein